MKRFALPFTNSLSLGRRGFLINFLAALVVYQVIVATQTPWASEAAQVHGTMAQIRERGQLFIELFPPLSYLAIHLTHHTHMVARLVCPAVVAIVLPRIMGISGDVSSLIGVTSGALLLSAAQYIRIQDESLLAIDTCTLFSRTVIIVLMGMCIAARSWKVFRLARGLGAIHFASTLCWLLGGTTAEALCLLGLVYVIEIAEFIVQLADRTISVSSLALKWTLVHLRFLFIIPAVLSTIVGLVFPWSETSSGGNYNLHYMPASSRRELRQGMASRFAQIPYVGSALHYDTAFTIYLPSAGFLRTDDLVWDPYYQAFDSNSNIATRAEESSMDVLDEGLHRVVFQDGIGRINPWVMTDATSDSELGKKGLVHDHRRVQIIDAQKGRYLLVEPQKTTLDRQYHTQGLSASSDNFVRFLVVTSDRIESSVEWEVQYANTSRGGFRLWNDRGQCFLSTSFRTFPDYDGDRTHDPVLHQMRLELEVVCSNNPKLAASTFYAVDGVQHQPPKLDTGLLGELLDYNAYAVQTMSRGATILRAMWDLRAFRRNYAGLQDTPLCLTVIS